MGFWETAGKVVGGYYGGNTGSQIGGAFGKGADTTIYKNNRSGHPSGGTAKQGIFSGTLRNSFSRGGTSALISGALQAYGNHKATKAHHNAQQTDLVQLRNEAERAGFNPLTALRATGGQGFQRGYAGGLSSANFYSALGNGITNYTDGAYQQKARDLEIMTNSKAYQLMGINDDPYAGYGEKIPVTIGLNKTYMKTNVAKRLGIEPNNDITPGDLAELLGEGWGEGSSLLFTQIQENVVDGGITSAMDQPKGGFGTNVFNWGKEKFKNHPYKLGYDVAYDNTSTGNAFFDFAMNLASNVSMPFGLAYTLADKSVQNFGNKLSNESSDSRVGFINSVTGLFSSASDFMTRNQPDYNEKFMITPINQQKKIMEQFP